MNDLTLSQDEIIKMTGYRRPAFQLKILKSLGINARRRCDNTILVLRMHCIHPAAHVPMDTPKLKSSRK